MSECYYNNDICNGKLWTCETCKEQYCEEHNHITDIGENVECVACEYNRIKTGKKDE